MGNAQEKLRRQFKKVIKCASSYDAKSEFSMWQLSYRVGYYRAAKLMNTNADVNVELRENYEGVIGILYYEGRDIHAADHHFEETSDDEDAAEDSESADQFECSGVVLHSAEISKERSRYRNMICISITCYIMHFYYMPH